LGGLPCTRPEKRGEFKEMFPISEEGRTNQVIKGTGEDQDRKEFGGSGAGGGHETEKSWRSSPVVAKTCGEKAEGNSRTYYGKEKGRRGQRREGAFLC